MIFIQSYLRAFNCQQKVVYLITIPSRVVYWLNTTIVKAKIPKKHIVVCQLSPTYLRETLEKFSYHSFDQLREVTLALLKGIRVQKNIPSSKLELRFHPKLYSHVSFVLPKPANNCSYYELRTDHLGHRIH